MALATPEERQQALQLLQMAQLAAKLGGASLDDELQQLVGRALAGDETVGLEDLLRRVIPVMGATAETAITTRLELKRELGDAASELASMDAFLMHPDLT